MNLIPSIGVAILTLNSKHHLSQCIPPFIHSPLKPKILVVDSSSEDGSVELAQAFGVETLTIPRAEFNHGTTRELARKQLKTDIVVMLTPDAYAVDESVLEKLVKPIIKGEASISYARQVPHDGAGFFEAFPREFNYPPESQLRSIEDIETFGVHLFFCSDSCAAYSTQALDEIGGFSAVLTGEDTVAAAKLLRKGHKIAYTADAVVKHSHNYSLLQEFKRYYDTGYARKEYADLIEAPSRDTRRGSQYTQLMIKSLLKTDPWRLPYGVIQCFVKFAGYKIGQCKP
jgi:rhamnosyltransferase